MNVKAILTCGFLVLVGSAANAQTIYDGPCWGGYYGYHGLYVHDHIPYYSLYPPVYYSYPIPRTYGYSPFAYPPGVMTPELRMEAVKPQTMINPYVPRDAKPAAEPQQTTRAPLRIVNPFVTDAAIEQLVSDRK